MPGDAYGLPTTTSFSALNLRDATGVDFYPSSIHAF